MRGLSLLFVPFAFNLNGLFGMPLFALFYGLDWVATVPPTVKLTIQAFGKEEGPIVYGWIAAGHQLGAASIALAAGVVRTVTLSYNDAFVASALLCLVAAFAVLGISAKRSPRMADARVKPSFGRV